MWTPYLQLNRRSIVYTFSYYISVDRGGSMFVLTNKHSFLFYIDKTNSLKNSCSLFCIFCCFEVLYQNEFTNYFKYTIDKIKSYKVLLRNRVLL